MSHSFIFVSDQDAAREFFTGKLGFELKADIPLGPSKKWLTVSPPGQADVEIVLMKAMEGPFFSASDAKAINDLVDGGVLGWCVFECKDIYATYEELSGKGVEFLHPPTETPGGLAANFRDNSGNWFSLKQAG